mmetsp:Transcript_13016/g.24451  ORF Transcript_13016/g.24451 Transcript_13016/m.24451 type:complete len:201 (+) Transcript_13016:1082-1684(+)
MTYQQAIANFRNEVNRHFPPDVSSSSGRRNSRRISQTTGRGHGRQGRGTSRGRGGRGRGQGSGGTSHHRGNKRNHTDARFIIDTNGSHMEVHPSYDFSSDEWRRIPQEEQKHLRQERKQYCNSRRRSTSQVQQQLANDGRSVISDVTSMTGSSTNIICCSTSWCSNDRHKGFRKNGLYDTSKNFDDKTLSCTTSTIYCHS